eukprot:14651476-Alexandrium_andersonii.AAC.1
MLRSRCAPGCAERGPRAVRAFIVSTTMRARSHDGAALRLQAAPRASIRGTSREVPSAVQGWGAQACFAAKASSGDRCLRARSATQRAQKRR